MPMTHVQIKQLLLSFVLLTALAEQRENDCLITPEKESAEHQLHARDFSCFSVLLIYTKLMND